MTVTIQSANGFWCAKLQDADDGTAVEIWQHFPRSMAKRVDVWLLPCPFHVARDEVYSIVWPLEYEATAPAMPKGYRPPVL